MRDSEFYSEIEHITFPRGGLDVPIPAFYYDVLSFGGYWPATMAEVKALLPSARMFPYRVSPGRTMVAITAYEYRDCDIGPYNEVVIGVPFTLDAPAPLFTGTLRRPKGIPKSYAVHLPVTTEVARYAGVEFYGYPKFLAQIDFEDQGEWIACCLAADGREILTIRGRRIPLVKTPRTRIHPFTARRGRLLRCELIMNERQAGMSRGGQDISLELGDHGISDQLRALGLGKALAYHYCPQFQSILTPAVESFRA